MNVLAVQKNSINQLQPGNTTESITLNGIEFSVHQPGRDPVPALHVKYIQSRETFILFGNNAELCTIGGSTVTDVNTIARVYFDIGEALLTLAKEINTRFFQNYFKSTPAFIPGTTVTAFLYARRLKLLADALEHLKLAKDSNEPKHSSVQRSLDRWIELIILRSEKWKIKGYAYKFLRINDRDCTHGILHFSGGRSKDDFTTVSIKNIDEQVSKLAAL